MTKKTHKLIADDQLELHKHLSGEKALPKAVSFHDGGVVSGGDTLWHNPAEAIANMGISTAMAIDPLNTALARLSDSGESSRARVASPSTMTGNLIPSAGTNIPCSITSIEHEAIETSLPMDTHRTFTNGLQIIHGEISDNVPFVQEELIGDDAAVICEVFGQDGSKSTSSGVITNLALDVNFNSPVLYTFSFRVTGQTEITV